MSTILVVDDEAMIRETLRDFLEFEGHHVLEAEDALVARSLLAQNKVDLAFLDVSMPGESGPELCARLKEDPDCKHIKVVILTGLDDEQHWREGLRSGADLYAVKPFGIERIRLIVGQLLGEDEA